MKNIFRVLSLLFLLPLSAFAADVELQIVSYDYSPDPIINAGSASLDLTVRNNGPDTAGSSSLVINLPTNITYVSNASGCTHLAGVLTCPITALNNGQSASVNYTAVGNTAGDQATDAEITINAADADSNPGNNTINKIVTVINGADLTVTHTGPAGCVTGGCTVNAGDTISYNVAVQNLGPDPATTFQVTYDLPPLVDFTFASANGGAGWSCPAPAGTTLMCTYSGANIAALASAPNIVVTGQVITSAGSITSGVSVASTDALVGDPDLANNGPDTVTVDVTPGTNLQANKAMVSDATGLTDMVNGEAVTLTLSVTNTGTQQATGVVVSDIVPGHFSVGALPAGCVAGPLPAIDCTVGTLNAGATSANFVIPLLVTGVAGDSGTNTATVERTGPVNGNNVSAVTNYNVVNDFAHLEITKTKTPSPVANGGIMTSTIRVKNSAGSVSDVSGTVTVEDRLSVNETFNGNVPANGWVCAVSVAGPPQTVTCTHLLAAPIAPNVSLPDLIIQTTAVTGGAVNISNDACTGNSISATQLPLDNAALTCASAAVTGTIQNSDLSITKATDNPLPGHVLIGDNDYTYTLVVTNNSVDIAPTVNVSDVLNAWYSGDAGTTTGSIVVAPALGAGEACNLGATTTCTLKNLTNGADRTITITLNRPFKDGLIANIATVSSPDAFDDTPGNNSASVDVNIDPIADVAVTSIVDAPDPVKIGVPLQYTTSVKNLGPSTANGVVIRHTIDPAKMDLVGGSVSLTSGGGVCNFVDPFVGVPHDGLAGIECTGVTLTNGQSSQLLFKVIPRFSFWNGNTGSYDSDASIITTTPESDAGNNTANNVANIEEDDIDLSVLKTEALGYDPDGAGPLNNEKHDPVAFGDVIKYLVTVNNNGPSLATQVVMTDVLTPPAGLTANYQSVVIDGSSTYTPAAVSCTAAGAGTNAAPETVTCYLAAVVGNSILPANQKTVLELTFLTGGAEPAGSTTFNNEARVESAETGAGPGYVGDDNTINNVASEPTTVLAKTDLYIQKAVDNGADGDGSPFNVNEPFNYILTLGNKGSAPSSELIVTDALPAGFVAAGNVTVTAGAGVALTTNTCNGAAWTGSCNLGSVPVDATGADATRQVVITIPVRAQSPYTGAINANITNTATIAPKPGTGIDIDGTNNSSSVDVQISNSSIAGTIFNDVNDDGTEAGGELGIGGVTVRLTGTDKYGNPVDITVNTIADGTYLFDKIPPSNPTGYTLTETQPAGYVDGLDNAGGATGANLIPGSRTTDVISTIIVNPSNALTGYDFAEVGGAESIAGVVWVDTNNDGVRDGAETGRIVNTTITLTGTDENGDPVNITTTTAADGSYRFDVRPSNAAGYTITETQPAGWTDGLESVGGGGGTVANDVFSAIVVVANDNLTDYDFGEIGGSISGTVYVDQSTDGIKDPAEPGIAGVTITLTGTDIDGNPINLVTTTGLDGKYSFDGLPMPNGTGYTLTETQPGGFADGLDTAGNLGGSTAVNDVISGITFPTPGATGINYNFGEGGPGVPAQISGSVWLDTNHNRTDDESGSQAGWTVELIESRADPLDNSNIVVVATTSTDASGNYIFDDLSPGTYEVRFRHPQGGFIYGTPLSGAGAGDTSNGTIHGINVIAGANIPNQDLPIDPSGVVYDAITRAPVLGATVTLAGPGGFNPAVDLVGGAANLSQVTGANGLYQFLLFNTAPAGTYTLAITSPAGYLPGVAASLPACTNTPTIGAAPDPALVQTSAFAPALANPIHDPSACPATSAGFAGGAGSTQYFLSFDINPALPSGNVVNNHIPLDPILGGAIVVTKTTPKTNVMRGELVPYTITISNTLASAFSDITLQDQIPPGFNYVKGSATIDGVKTEPTVAGRSLDWPGQNLPANGVKTIQLILIVGAGVSEGKYINQAWALNALAGTRVSNIATAAVRVIPDPLFDCSDLIGKVFDDKNINGYQDEGEPGLAGVRVVTPRGLLITTDDYGRFHIACADVPNELHGSNFLMKLDTRTLPSGYRVTTENPRVVRLTRGKLVKLNFGAALHRVLRVDIDNLAFSDNGEQLTSIASTQLDELIDILKKQPSQVRLSYGLGANEDKADAQTRMQVFTDHLEMLWQECDCSNYALTVEQEVIMRDGDTAVWSTKGRVTP